MAFSFGFTGDDIEPSTVPSVPVVTPSAFPVQGKPQLPPQYHPLTTLLQTLPSKIAFGVLDVILDDGSVMHIPRRELWDVRLQIMAEDDGKDGVEGLGESDVKTGVYEGGFKSWESSVDLVKVLAKETFKGERVIELGCGTALPSLALFQWGIQKSTTGVTFVAADYNPSVLQLVTLPNFILTWALANKPTLEEAFTEDNELELTPEVLSSFESHLTATNTKLAFFSGAWSLEFVSQVNSHTQATSTVVLGAETIYSPFALQAFTDVMFALLGEGVVAYVAAKQHYFGVGGSLGDFIERAREKGAVVDGIREETEGVRRGVVRCVLIE